jgi:type IV pilus assembly protein PilP
MRGTFLKARILGLCALVAVLAACSSADDELPGGAAGVPGVRPDAKRNREFLETFSLDTLRMVGTLKLAGQTYGLVQTKDGLVHRVVPGNYVGTNDGKVIDVSPSKIQVIEIVPDGLGGYMERAAALALNE